MGIFDFLKSEKKTTYTICINREYGSGGSEIARMISKKLSIPLYDEKTIELKSLESGFDQDILKGEEIMPKDTIYDLYMENKSINKEDLFSNEAAFLSQSKAIRHLASMGPCIFLEKCASYVLKDQENILKIFIHAPYEFRRKRAMQVHKDTNENVDARIKKYDSRRRNFYNKNTKKEWQDAMEYDISIDASIFSLSEVAEIIADIVRIKESEDLL
ncbi:cytidylate kinase-like family protein [Peptoniphilus sp. GNH]|nr:hypothetical protein HMPREF3189_00885 [Clostridiales bacterium KA00134]UHR03550.1 cytidylate kinase-like family protein [Peptoniphilus sp. GNH]